VLIKKVKSQLVIASCAKAERRLVAKMLSIPGLRLRFEKKAIVSQLFQSIARYSYHIHSPHLSITHHLSERGAGRLCFKFFACNSCVEDVITYIMCSDSENNTPCLNLSQSVSRTQSIPLTTIRCDWELF